MQKHKTNERTNDQNVWNAFQNKRNVFGRDCVDFAR